MSRVRHNFLVGKGGVGIAAVQQTSQAVHQLSSTIIDPARIAEKDRGVLGDGSILLSHNRIEIGGKSYATVSAIKDQAGQYISDKISQYINGYVDIAKDPFIVQLGANQREAGTFMLLEKLGVPSPTVVFFMNQPIIREYNKAWATREKEEFQEEILNSLYARFPIGEQEPATQIKETSLKENIQKFYREGTLSQRENVEQRLILTEYFKYKKMAEEFFLLTRSTSYDTANFSDPNLLYLKQILTRQAQAGSLFSSPQALLDNSFIGASRDALVSARDMIASTLLQFDHPQVRAYFTNTFRELARSIRGQKEFLGAARKLEQSFIQYLAQISTHLNGKLPLLLREQASALTTQLATLKGSLRDNLVIKNLRLSVGNTPTATKNVSLASRSLDVFTSNQYTAALREVKIIHPALYGSLIRAAFLQAGITAQNNSLSSIIPTEDFKEFLLPALQALSNTERLLGFEKTDAFYRNNWANADIIPRIKENWKYSEAAGRMLEKRIIATPWLKELGVPFGYKVSEKARAFSSRFVVLQRNNPAISKKEREERIKNGDWSFRQTFLLRRIDEQENTPLTQPYSKNAKFGNYAIYIPVHGWGDGYRAQEYYEQIRPSALDNHVYQPAVEPTNEQLVAAFSNKPFTVSSPTDFLKKGNC